MGELKLPNKQEFCNSLHTNGFVILDASPTLASVIQRLFQEAPQFFQMDEKEKSKICCEYISKKNTKNYRDRLEVTSYSQ
jgi:isopenicillin N synthase-like dioxygenase